MQDQERRASESNRTPLETIVEIRGSGADLQPFEAEVIDVSGRGMHVRTAYLPSVGASLICRFHHRGREVLVEGVVAWRIEQARGGDFGVQFTAIDKESVEVLKGVCADSEDEAGDSRGVDAASDVEELVGLGARVRLHIEGLDAPMKAAVRDSSSRTLRVGSNLEFLRVGRRLELEAQECHERRDARIDGVDVVIDPQTGIPQLMVTLRLRGGDRTPAPSVVDASTDGRDSGAAREKPTAFAAHKDAARFEQAVAAEGERLHRRLSEQLGAFAEHAGTFLESSAGRLSTMGLRGIGGAGRLAGRAVAAAKSLGKSRAQKAKSVQRVTAPAPNGGYGKPRGRPAEPLRSQDSTRAPRDAASIPRPGGNARRTPGVGPKQPGLNGRRIAKVSAGGGAVALLLALVLRATGGGVEAPFEEGTADSGATTVGTGAAAVPIASAGGPLGAPPARSRGKSGIVANVPLFGEVRMAPTEPVAPAPEVPEHRADPGEHAPAPAPAPARVPDETWESAPAAKVIPGTVSPARSTGGDAESNAVTPWGRGKLHLPTVHELPLNAPGAGLEGSVEATGFSVFVPDRTVSSDTLAISRRDSRIVKVLTQNTKDGARIRFRFRDEVPSYKVRLKSDKIQFLISAPE